METRYKSIQLKAQKTFGQQEGTTCLFCMEEIPMRIAVITSMCFLGTFGTN